MARLQMCHSCQTARLCKTATLDCKTLQVAQPHLTNCKTSLPKPVPAAAALDWPLQSKSASLCNLTSNQTGQTTTLAKATLLQPHLHRVPNFKSMLPTPPPPQTTLNPETKQNQPKPTAHGVESTRHQTNPKQIWLLARCKSANCHQCSTHCTVLGGGKFGQEFTGPNHPKLTGLMLPSYTNLGVVPTVLKVKQIWPLQDVANLQPLPT